MDSKQLTIGFITCLDPRDKRSWSGIHYRMLEALERECGRMILLAPIKEPFVLRQLLRVKDICYRIFRGKRYSTSHSRMRSKYFARVLKKRMERLRIDVLFAPAAAIEIASLDTHLPICFFSDTSFSQINEYYGLFTGLCETSLRESAQLEVQAIAKATTCVYSSEWAARHVIEHYGKDPDQVFVVKFGANVDALPHEGAFPSKKMTPVFNLLFLGVDWQRKGGDIAFEAFSILLDRGYQVHLTICGCAPDITHPKVQIIPFLDKNKREDRIAFDRLLHSSHLLFVPTRADCTPVVFCEACAYGLPICTTDTGGVTALVENGMNGYALPESAGAEVYADKIAELIDNPGLYKRLSGASRTAYEREFNWETWGKKMKDILLKTVR